MSSRSPGSRRPRARSKNACASAARRRGSNSTWRSIGRIGARACLRLGHFTLLPDAFDADRAATGHHQWRRPRDFCPGRPDHRSRRAGVVPGFVQPRLRHDRRLGRDRRRARRACASRWTAPTRRCWGCSPIAARARSLFCQVQLSALELDDTRKPGAYRPGPRRFRFSVQRFSFRPSRLGRDFLPLRGVAASGGRCPPAGLPALADRWGHIKKPTGDAPRHRPSAPCPTE